MFFCYGGIIRGDNDNLISFLLHFIQGVVMPKKPRIELAGKYHIINRGVAQMHIFKEPSDYEYLEELMCFYAKSFGITIHNYCLMGNHYHLLLEIQSQNLSKYRYCP